MDGVSILALVDIISEIIKVPLLHIPAHPDGESGGIRTANRNYSDTLSVDLIRY